ncbi:MAG: xanthine dehydrogenase family protein molybdopterin-binding subunit [Burkholderiaceae bacterium]|nr:xanthine dehydrogenase family protein molybdopterin-binding subunit [Burkholderiaceae bacterium]
MKFGIGQAVTRIEDDRLLTGRGRYADDLDLPGALHLLLLRSPHAHARVVTVEADALRAADGVVAVYTGADLAADGVAPFPTSPGFKRADGTPMTSAPYPALATDTVRYVGQPVAAIVARSRAQAEAAAAQAWVDYEPLPAVVDLADALAPGAVVVWDGAPDNVAAVARYGDVALCEAAFARAAHVARVRVINQRLAPVTLEPRAGAASFDAGSGRLTLHASSQNPAGFQKALATVLKMKPADVRVVVGDVGGGFGMKTLLQPEDVLAAFAAKTLGVPVRWRVSRLEDFQAGSHGRDQVGEAQLALDAEHRIVGLRVRLTGNLGAYAHGAGAAIHLALTEKVITSVYHVPVLDLVATAVFTHTNVVSAYRGAGRPEAIYLIERLMDQAAADLKLDPAELRRRNLITPAQLPYKTALGESYDSGDFPAILARALQAADWAGFDARRHASQVRGRLRGRAVSTFLEWTGVVHQEQVRLQVDASGEVPKIRVFTAMQAMGQGIETSYVQILADTLQIDPARIEVVQGDSDTAQGIGSMGSRSLYIGGSAMFTASNETITLGRQLAAGALEAPADDLSYANGRFTVAGTDLGVDLFDLAAKQPERRIVVDTLQKVGGPSWPNGCHVCEVEVDPDTGTTQIVRYTTVDDVGRVINPMIVAGQIHGGIAQAVGQALMEAVHYDRDSGQLVTGSFMDYALPRADDLPEITTITDESQPCKINPLGAKGVGELGTVGATPTVINALLDALRPLGVTDIEMPATAERVWRAVRAARG